MVEAIINSIIEAETEAENIKKDAIFSVKKIIEDAEINAEEIRSSSIKHSRSILKENEIESEKIALKSYDEILKNGEKEIIVMKEKALKNKSKGTKFLFDKLMNY